MRTRLAVVALLILTSGCSLGGTDRGTLSPVPVPSVDATTDANGRCLAPRPPSSDRTASGKKPAVGPHVGAPTGGTPNGTVRSLDGAEWLGERIRPFVYRLVGTERRNGTHLWVLRATVPAPVIVRDVDHYERPLRVPVGRFQVTDTGTTRVERSPEFCGIEPGGGPGSGPNPDTTIAPPG